MPVSSMGMAIQTSPLPQKESDLKASNIKVCMRCDTYLPLFSGASTQAHRLSQSLSARGLKIIVLTGRYPGTTEKETIDGIPIQRTGLINSNFPYIRPFSLAISSIPALFRLRRNYDILHFHSIKVFDFLLIYFARMLGKKTVIKMTLLGSLGDPATWSSNPEGYLPRLAYKAADRVISISRSLSENYLKSGLDPKKLRQLPQGVDINRFCPVTKSGKNCLRKTLGLRIDARYLCFLGSFKYRKGADILVDTFLTLADEFPDLCLLVVGPDTFYDPVRRDLPYASFAQGLKSKIAQAGLSERVFFSGFVNNVEAYLQAADIFMFPSRREGFPTSIIEALAVGLPSVLAPLDGVSSEITNEGETALIASSEQPADYAQLIRNLLANSQETRQMVKRARLRVEQEYDFEIVSRKYADLYQELVSKDWKLEHLVYQHPAKDAKDF